MSRGWRPSLLMLTAISAFGATVAHGIGVVAPAPVPLTRLGVAINKDAATQDQAAAGRSRQLDLREQAARATEARIKADLAVRAAAVATPKAGVPAEGGEQFDSLARVYQAMKPAPAAAVFEKLDIDVQFQVAKRMRDRSLGMILASMSPVAATNLSMALARKSAYSAPRPVVSTPVVKAQAEPKS